MGWLIIIGFLIFVAVNGAKAIGESSGGGMGCGCLVVILLFLGILFVNLM